MDREDNGVATGNCYFPGEAIRMEKREDLQSILQYLPLVDQSSSLVWPPSVEAELQTMSRGPRKSMVNSGEALALHIMKMRKSLSLSASDFAHYVLQGYALFFDEKISREEESAKFFGEVVSALSGLLLQLPSRLEMHYQKADHVLDGNTSGLRLLAPQESGIVFLSQELIAALLACSFFCLFPEVDRRSKHLQGINFDELFSFLYTCQLTKQDNKIRCIIHYFERICPALFLFVSVQREVNKAFSGYLHQCKHQVDPPLSSSDSASKVVESSRGLCIDHEGVATGNWGCGVFGGDPEIKTMIQWLAISQVIEKVALQEWTVGDLWN